MDCEDYIRKLIKDDTLSEEEIYEIGAMANRIKERVEQEKQLTATDPDMVKLAEDQAKYEELKALQKKRNVILQYQARTKLLDFCLTHFKGMEVEGLIAKMVGSKYTRRGARGSVDELASSLQNSYVGQLYTDIMALGDGHVKLFASNKIEREIVNALYYLGTDPAQFKGPREAMQIAGAIHKAQERARMDQNQAGAWIDNLPGYIVRQSHDAAKIKKAGYEAWRKNIRDRLDWTKTAEGKYAQDQAGREEFLYGTWKALVTGKHLKHTPEGNPLTTATNSIMGSEAARVSHERVLHFVNGDAWYEYNAQFGRGGLNEAVIHGLTQAAGSTALMRVFGPSPQATLNWVFDQLGAKLQKQGHVERVTALQNSRAKLNDLMKLLDGTENIDGNLTAASVGRIVRAGQSMAKLGGALVSSISDTANVGFEFAYHGKGFFAGMRDAFHYFLEGRPSKEQMRIAAQCGVFFDTLIGTVAARFSDDSLSGKMAAAQNMFFKLNGLGFWTDAWKKSVVLTMSYDLAQMRGKGFADLPKGYQRTLELYGMDGERWEIIRQTATTMADGREYLTADNILNVDDKIVVAYLQKHKRSTSESNVLRVKNELADQLRTYFRDRVQSAVLEPDARNKYMLRRGTAAGTWPGEILRYATQFKSFPFLFVDRVMGREIYGRGADTLGRGLAQQFAGGVAGERGNFFQMFLAMTALGYLAMQAKAVAAGKTPRDLSYKSIMAGALQGGGLGIMGDFLFGDFSRIGTGVIASLAGPTAGTAEGIMRLMSKIRNGDIDVGPDAFRQLWSLIPGANLVYLQAILNMGIVHPLNEYMRPGYWRRLERRIKTENDQTFWVKPMEW